MEKTKLNDNEKASMISQLIMSTTPDYQAVIKDVENFIQKHPELSKEGLAEKYANRIKWQYTSVGAATAAPGMIPGLGTAVQIGVEVAAIGTDLSLMFRYMAKMTYGISHIFKVDISDDFQNEFVTTLGLWSGVIVASATAGELFAKKVGAKAAVKSFGKNVPYKMLQKINNKIGFTLLKKFGARKGGVALGSLIPFGIGTAVGGTFNYAVMNKYKNNVIKHFKNYEENNYAYFD
jgi:hypothetical protein